MTLANLLTSVSFSFFILLYDRDELDYDFQTELSNPKSEPLYTYEGRICLHQNILKWGLRIYLF